MGGPDRGLQGRRTVMSLLGHCGSSGSISQGLSSLQGGLAIQLTSLGSANSSLPLRPKVLMALLLLAPGTSSHPWLP